MRRLIICFALTLLVAPAGAGAADPIADRVAIERVFYEHLAGAKPPFAEVMPRSRAERLVREDTRRAALLQKIYKVEISDQRVDTALATIDATTQAPEMLAALKAALSNDPVRFKQTVVRPLVVDRELRERFATDARAQNSPRQKLDALRHQLITAKRANADVTNLLAIMNQSKAGSLMDTSWRVAERSAGAADPRTPFDALPEPLQQVLHAQLREPGDISALVELPESFVLCLVKGTNDAMLNASVISLPKLTFEQWIAQPDEVLLKSSQVQSTVKE